MTERTSGKWQTSTLCAAVATLVAFFLCVQTAAAAPAPNWGEEHPANSPSARESAAMAFDATNQELVLFGGQTEAGVRLGDTWTWDGENWTLESPVHSPSPQSTASMAFDASTGQMLLVGGQSGEGTLGETWNWNGSDWIKLTPETPAPVVSNPSVAYDPQTQGVLLFGGQAASGDNQNLTWSWNGTTWTQLTPQSSPSPRWGAAMTYDPVNQEMVLFGGIGVNTGFADTWTWDGSDWNRETPVNSPPLSFGNPLVYSPAIGSLLKLSGQDMVTGDTETWSWNGTDWSRVITLANPPARFAYPAALDEASGMVLLFGGLQMEGPVLGDTWTFGARTDQAPVATITEPADNSTFEIHSQVPVSFTCEAATDGPVVATCIGSDGAQGNADGGRSDLDTSSLGTHTYSVEATATDGQTGTASITYEVIPGKPPKPSCHEVRGGLTVGTFGLRPPLGDAAPVPGIRVRLGARGDIVAKIKPMIIFASHGWSDSTSLKPRTIRIDHSRKLRFRLPAYAKREIRRENDSLYGVRVIFSPLASIKVRGDRSSCFRETAHRTARIEITNVSSRVALRRR